jgi:excisionase family DNA binding protein
MIQEKENSMTVVQRESSVVQDGKLLNALLDEVKEIKDLIRYQADKILTLSQAAKYLGITDSALYKLTHKSEIAFYKPHGKRIYFLKSELDKWIFAKRSRPKHEIQNNLSEKEATSLIR